MAMPWSVDQAKHSDRSSAAEPARIFSRSSSQVQVQVHPPGRGGGSPAPSSIFADTHIIGQLTMRTETSDITTACHFRRDRQVRLARHGKSPRRPGRQSPRSTATCARRRLTANASTTAVAPTASSFGSPPFAGCCHRRTHFGTSEGRRHVLIKRWYSYYYKLVHDENRCSCFQPNRHGPVWHATFITDT